MLVSLPCPLCHCVTFEGKKKKKKLLNLFFMINSFLTDFEFCLAFQMESSERKSARKGWFPMRGRAEEGGVAGWEGERFECLECGEG